MREVDSPQGEDGGIVVKTKINNKKRASKTIPQSRYARQPPLHKGAFVYANQSPLQTPIFYSPLYFFKYSYKKARPLCSTTKALRGVKSVCGRIDSVRGTALLFSVVCKNALETYKFLEK